MPLTDIKCKTAKPTSKIQKLFDGGGLYLEIKPSGSKTWRYKFNYLGKEKNLTLGKYPETELKEAREKHREAHKAVFNGENPIELKQMKILSKRIETANTFEAIAREWLEKRKLEVKPQTLSDIKNRLEKELFPKIGNMPVKSITSPIIHDALKKIEERGVFETTRRVRQYASQIFRYAIASGKAEYDPSHAIIGALKSKKVEHYKAMPIAELPNFLRKIDANEKRLYRQTILALKLMNLTFTRKTELTEAKWSEFDFENKMWVIPAERMKMNKSHIVPLSKQSLEILAELQRINGNWEYVFSSQIKPSKPMNNDTPLRALYTMGYKNIHTVHGFRALAMTAILENLNYTSEIIDVQLAHGKRNPLGSAYDRAEYLKERKQMMQDWADYIDKLRDTK
jgi:integrase